MKGKKFILKSFFLKVIKKLLFGVWNGNRVWVGMIFSVLLLIFEIFTINILKMIVIFIGATHFIVILEDLDVLAVFLRFFIDGLVVVGV